MQFVYHIEADDTFILSGELDGKLGEPMLALTYDLPVTRSVDGRAYLSKSQFAVALRTYKLELETDLETTKSLLKLIK